MVISELVREVAGNITDNARFEAELIVMSVMNIDRTKMILGGNENVSEEEYQQITEIIKRRKNGEPLQYILGETEFMSLDFYVEEGVLIPRSDTEILVETVMDLVDDNDEILDICTGSGCIGISLAKYAKDSRVTLADISKGALETAKRNAVKNGVKVEAVQLDILQEIPEGKFDIVVSNPPYIETEVVKGLDSTVKDYEPITALDGGEDGLIFYRRITEIAPQLLNDGGMLAYEIGYNQGESVSKIVKAVFGNVRIIKDYCNNDRVVIAVK